MDYNSLFKTLVDKADAGDEDGKNKLHDLYANEIDEYQTLTKEQIDEYKDKCIQNKPYSLYHYGKLLWNGIDIKQDKSEAIEYFIKSSIVNCSQAYYELAILHQTNATTYGNYDELLDKAKELNNSNAVVLKGSEYENTNPVKMIECYNQAINLGNSVAAGLLGVYYEFQFNFEMAKKNYKFGAKKNAN